MPPGWVVTIDRRRGIWIALLWVAAVGTGVFLFAQGAKGAENAQNVSLAISIGSLLVAVAGMQRPRNEQAPAELRLTARLVVALGVVIALILGATLWLLIHRPDRNITDLLVVQRGQGMSADSTADLLYDGSPDRNYLALTLDLKNSKSVGNCVEPARMTVIYRVDGKARGLAEAVSGQEVTLDVSGAERRVEARVELIVRDLGCRLELDVAEAVLHN